MKLSVVRCVTVFACFTYLLTYLRHTGGPSPELWGVFIIAVHRAFVLGLGAQHRGIVKLSEGG